MAFVRSTGVAARSIERGSVAVRTRLTVSSSTWIRNSVFQSAVSTLLQRQRNHAPRPFSSFASLRKEDVPHPSGIPPPKIYNYQEIHDLTIDPSPNRIIIDVREPAELLQTGRIPTAKSVPISSAPDAFFLDKEDFETKFGFPRPGEQDEVIFYCKAGVRSRQAALLAGQAVPTFGGKIANYNGSWLDWEKNGGVVEKEGEQGEQSSVTGTTNPGQGAPSTPRP